MPQSRDLILWNTIKGHASAESGQRADAVESRARAFVVQTKNEIQATQDARADQVTAALAGKAPIVHTQAIATIIGLQAALQALQTRIAALEAKVP